MNTFHALRRDLLHAARSLFKDRGFTVVCVVSLGIGIGALVALTTFVRAITAPARGINTEGLMEVLVLPVGPLRAKAGEWALSQWSYPDFQSLRDANTGMAITGWAQDSVEVGVKTPGATTPETEAPPRAAALFVTANYFSTLGVSLARGTGFDPAIDDAASGEARVVISEDFWRSRMSSDPDIIGKPLTVNGIPHTIVGVTPVDFRGHFHFFQAPSSLLFIPLERHPRLKATPNLRDDRTVDWVRIQARLKSGVTRTDANALVATTVTGLAQRYPATNQYKQATVEPYVSMGAAGRPESERVTLILLGLSATVLLIVCLNISGMMLVRGANRERELSIRAALGAGRSQLIGHLFLEAVLLAFVSGGIAAFVLFGVPAGIGWWMGFPVPQEIDFDATGLAISSGLCLLVSVLFGLLPAVRFSRPNLVNALKEDARGGGRHTIRVHRVAALVQIGIAVPFLAISGVMIDRVRTADFGFPTDGLAGARLPVPEGSAREASFAIQRVRDNLTQAAGVRSVALAAGMPIDFDYREFRVASGDDTFATAHVTNVAENFLETVGAKLLRGRTISADDRAQAAPVAVISEPLARQLFPGKEAIGQHLKVSIEDNREQELTIIGVTADFASSQLTTTRLQLLMPLPEVLPRSVFLIARGAPGDEPKLKAALETALRELGVEAQPGVAFPGIVTGEDLADKSQSDLVAEGTAVGVAGGLVLILAALGIIGVVGFMVATRTKEFAVRMALGSSRLGVFRLMLSNIIKLVIPGVLGGIVIAAVLIRSLENVMGTPLTMGAKPLGVMEPVIYMGASAIAITVALLAGLPAARRATNVQPMVAIKSE